MQIDPNKSYPIVLGDSFKDDAVKSQDITIVRYDFIPASVAASGHGKLLVAEQGTQATIKLPSNNTTLEEAEADPPSLRFTGCYESSSSSTTNSDRLECIALFDGTGFTLELIDAQAKVRHAPGVGKRQVNPPPPAKLRTRRLPTGRKKAGGGGGGGGGGSTKAAATAATALDIEPAEEQEEEVLEQQPTVSIQQQPPLEEEDKAAYSEMERSFFEGNA